MGFAFIKHDTHIDFIGKRRWAYASHPPFMLS